MERLGSMTIRELEGTKCCLNISNDESGSCILQDVEPNSRDSIGTDANCEGTGGCGPLHRVR